MRESFAANVDPAESDLRRGKLPAVARRRASGGRATRRVEIWHLLGALALLTLLGESLLVRRG